MWTESRVFHPLFLNWHLCTTLVNGADAAKILARLEQLVGEPRLRSSASTKKTGNLFFRKVCLR